MSKKTTKELFARVPQTLTAHPGINTVDKLIYTHLLGKYQTKREDGQPYTFSVPGIATGTGLIERTVLRHMPGIRKSGILKFYGTLMNGKKHYDVFVFVPKALETLISTADKMSVVIPLQDNKVEAISETSTDKTADNESAKMSDRSKKIEERYVQGKEKEESTSTGENRLQPLKDAFKDFYKPAPIYQDIGKKAPSKTNHRTPRQSYGGLDDLIGFDPDA